MGRWRENISQDLILTVQALACGTSQLTFPFLSSPVGFLKKLSEFLILLLHAGFKRQEKTESPHFPLPHRWLPRQKPEKSLLHSSSPSISRHTRERATPQAFVHTKNPSVSPKRATSLISSSRSLPFCTLKLPPKVFKERSTVLKLSGSSSFFVAVLSVASRGTQSGVNFRNQGTEV